MDISSVSSSLGLTQDLAASNVASAEATEFKNVLTNAMNSGEDEELKKACDQLESYMLSMVFKQVKESMLSDGEDSLIPKGDYVKMFEGNMINALADEVTEAGGIGLSKAIYKQMKATYDAQMQMSNEQAKADTSIDEK